MYTIQVDRRTVAEYSGWYEAFEFARMLTTPPRKEFTLPGIQRWVKTVLADGQLAWCYDNVRIVRG